MKFCSRDKHLNFDIVIIIYQISHRFYNATEGRMRRRQLQPEVEVRCCKCPHFCHRHRISFPWWLDPLASSGPGMLGLPWPWGHCVGKGETQSSPYGWRSHGRWPSWRSPRRTSALWPPVHIYRLGVRFPATSRRDPHTHHIYRHSATIVSETNK